jgi:hypothetical protein
MVFKRLWKLAVPVFALVLITACNNGQEMEEDIQEVPANSDINPEEPADGELNTEEPANDDPDTEEPADEELNTEEPSEE